jgi:putative membrane protein
VTFGLAAIGAGGAAIVALVAWFGVQSITADVLQALWVVPFTVLLLFGQLYLSALAWRTVVGGRRPRVGVYFRIRWIREAVNSMLPVAQLGGNLVGIRLLTQRGVPGPLAGAGTTLDLTVEAVTQFLFTFAGISVLAAIDADRAAEPWVKAALTTMPLALAGFIIAQRAGLLRVIEWVAARLTRFFPRLSMDAVRGLHAELMRLHRDGWALARATALHLLAWSLGTAETWIALTAMGRPTSFCEAFVIESLGMAARSAGFAVPAALGVQEAGLIVVCGLFAIPPETAIALSMVKRARELAVGLPGLVAWQWSEGKQLFARKQARAAYAPVMDSRLRGNDDRS